MESTENSGNFRSRVKLVSAEIIQENTVFVTLLLSLGEADYDLSLSHLDSIMKSQDFSMSTLQYLIAECTYGGRQELTIERI